MKLYCPSCGTPVEVRYDDSFVRVCDACHVALARSDRGYDTLGQFADLGPAASGLSVSDQGRWQGQAFVLVGRAEYAHPAGGTWEEWYLRLADGRWAWLSHAHGSWAITVKSTEALSVPGFEQIGPGMQITLGSGLGVALTVGERNAGSLRAVEGELPFLFTPGALSRFVDLSDAKGRVATLDYGPPANEAPPTVYIGRRTSLADLGLRPTPVALADEGPARAGERLACPNCGGGIELRVPDRSLCVTCSYCGSLLDCEGPLAILAQRDAVQEGYADIPLGAVGRFEGTPYTVTGRLRRRADYPGGFFEWDEYLLYAPAQGYRWLVCARGHYSFTSPLAPGAIATPSGQRIEYRDRSFQLFDRGTAVVSGVWGEFYWKVGVGESVQTEDYVAPPLMLSRESSDTELHWSLGVYRSHAEIQRAFGLASLPNVARGTAPNQPFPHPHWLGVAALLLVVLIASVLLRIVTADGRPLYSGTFQLGSSAADGAGTANLGAAPGASYVFFTPPFQVRPRCNVSVALSLPLANDWAYATVDLVDEATGGVRSYGAELSYYSGVEGGERWSEGSSQNQHLFGAGSAGSHVLRVEVQTPHPSTQSLSVEVIEDVFAVGQLGWVLLLLGVPAGLFGLAQYVVELWRWSESDFAPKRYRRE